MHSYFSGTRQVEYYMAKCVMCIFHENDKRMENAWFLTNYNEAKTMRLSKCMENACGTIGHVEHESEAQDPALCFLQRLLRKSLSAG